MGAHLGVEQVPDAEAVVAFASEQLCTGRLRKTATQEDMLFSSRPELFPLMLLCERLQDHEAATVRGARRFCECSGYGESFHFVGPVRLPAAPAPPPPTVVAIDASSYA